MKMKEIGEAIWYGLAISFCMHLLEEMSLVPDMSFIWTFSIFLATFIIGTRLIAAYEYWYAKRVLRKALINYLIANGMNPKEYDLKNFKVIEVDGQDVFEIEKLEGKGDK